MSSDRRHEAASAEYLTDAMRRSGAIGDGHVSEVEIESSRSLLLSQVIRLRLKYDRGIPAAPNTLILKTGLDGDSAKRPDIGRAEVTFYDKVAREMPPGTLPACVDARFNADTATWHLLLEDLTDSHFIATTWPLPPTREQCEAIIDVRARCHALWWDDPRLGTSIGTLPDIAASDKYQRDLTGHFARFVDQLGDKLSSDRRALYEQYFEVLPDLLAQRRTRRDLTIVHGDAHVWNCFLPRDSSDSIRLFDWDGWRIGVAAADLAYMMAVHWYPDRRRLFERPLLDRYHATLLAHGVIGYDRGALEDDYRVATLMSLATPVFFVAFGIPPYVWWNHLERIMMAVDDLGCRDLLR